MNKITIFLLVIIMGVITSCQNELNQIPISSETTGSFYTTSTDFIQGVNAIYNSLHSYPDRMLNLSETRSDNLYAVMNQGTRDGSPINNFEVTIASHNFIADAWNNNSNGIFRANVLLDQLKANGDKILNPDLRIRLEAEAKFLRAFFYFDMVRWFGKLPIVDHVISPKEAFSIPRSPVSDVYELIISDLKFATNNLPEEYSLKSDKGRVSKYAAKGILALVHMTRSGTSYAIEGPGLSLNEWNLALPLLNDIIESGKYSFLSNYSDIFSYDNENNKEVIFGIAFAGGATPRLGSTFPWLLVPDSYFQSLGYSAQGGLGIRPVSNDLVDEYEENDIRKSSTIFLSGYTYNGVQETQPFFKKYLNVTHIPTNASDWPIDFIALRYTDILMLKAECILNGATPGTQTDVDLIINKVRERGSLETKSNFTLSQLIEERRKEFAAEGSRWHDLVRSGLVESVMSNWIISEDVQNRINMFNRNFIIYPIPQAEIDAKQGLYTQNNGY